MPARIAVAQVESVPGDVEADVGGHVALVAEAGARGADIDGPGGPSPRW